VGYCVAPQAYAQMQVVEQAIVGTGSLDDGRLAQFTRDASFKTVIGDGKFGQGGGWSEARVLEVQYQSIRAADLSDFKDGRTQTVVWPSNLASGALIYPYQRRSGTFEAGNLVLAVQTNWRHQGEQDAGDVSHKCQWRRACRNG
jgi:hypothetical protein